LHTSWTGKIYVANAGSSTVTRYDPGGTLIPPTITGASGLNAPVGIAVDAVGMIYVVNADNYSLTTYDLSGSRTTPTITGLLGPTGIAIR
jgi:DNA-binding beta-propeller fold protein YncE